MKFGRVWKKSLNGFALRFAEVVQRLGRTATVIKRPEMGEELNPFPQLMLMMLYALSDFVQSLANAASSLARRSEHEFHDFSS